MESLQILSLEEFKVFLLILIRVSVVLFSFPIFGGQMLPMLAKAGLSLVLAILLYPIVSVDVSVFPKNIIDVVMLMFCEGLIGLILGMTIRIFFGAVQMAGEVVGFQMGFSMINVVDPQMGTNVSIIEQIGYWVVMLLFLVLNGHHVFILGMAESFTIVKVGGVMMKKGLLDTLIALSVQMFILAIKIGAPAIAALFFVNVGFGITAKFAPTMNVMMVSFPVNISVGLLLFGFTLQITGEMTRHYVKNFYKLVSMLLVWLGGG